MNTQYYNFGTTSIKAEAVLYARNINLRKMPSTDKIASIPYTMRLTETSFAVLFRYGVVVYFNANEADKNHLVSNLESYIVNSLPQKESEQLEIIIAPEGKERFEADQIFVTDASIAKLQLIAEALAKSTILSHNESELEHAFDKIEPLALELSQKGRTKRDPKQLQMIVGNILLREHTLVARAESSERPGVLWEYPELNNLYTNLSYELELDDRSKALQEKIDLATKIVSTTVDLIQNESSLRVEWLIVLLIVIEIMLTILEHTNIL